MRVLIIGTDKEGCREVNLFLPLYLFRCSCHLIPFEGGGRIRLVCLLLDCGWEVYYA